MQRTEKPALRFRGLVVAALIAVASSACAADAPVTRPTPADGVKAGQWGGQHISMTVTAERTDIEFDCGKATVNGTIGTIGDGSFTVTGTFTPERPGPTTRNPPADRPMRLSGSVKDDTMQVSIVLTDQNEDLGTFTLGFGTTPRLVKCK